MKHDQPWSTKNIPKQPRTTQNNPEQPRSTTINLDQPRSTQINLDQPRSTQINQTIQINQDKPRSTQINQTTQFNPDLTSGLTDLTSGLPLAHLWADSQACYSFTWFEAWLVQKIITLRLERGLNWPNFGHNDSIWDLIRHFLEFWLIWNLI